MSFEARIDLEIGASWSDLGIIGISLAFVYSCTICLDERPVEVKKLPTQFL